MQEVAPIKFTATDYRISTITVTGGVNCDVCLSNLYTLMSKHSNINEISYLEYGSNKHDLLSTGVKIVNLKETRSQPKQLLANGLIIN